MSPGIGAEEIEKMLKIHFCHYSSLSLTLQSSILYTSTHQHRKSLYAPAPGENGEGQEHIAYTGELVPLN